MRNRTEEINVRVFKTEKNLIRRKARKCGMNMSEYLRTLGTDATVKEAPREELMQAYRKLTRLHDGIRYEVSMAAPTTPESLTPPARHSSAPAATQTRSQTIRQKRKGRRLCFSDQISETAS